MARASNVRKKKKLVRLIRDTKGVARWGLTGAMPPPNPSWTKTRILVIIINTCHCIIVFLLGLQLCPLRYDGIFYDI